MSAPDAGAARPERPGYLIAALLALWAVGMVEIAEGWSAVRVVTDPLGAFSSISRGGAPGSAQLVSALGSHAEVTLPIGIAEILLGGLLAVLAVRALLGRQVRAALVLQAVIADAALLVVAWVLEAPVRESLLDALVAASAELPELGHGQVGLQAALRSRIDWLFRAMLGLELGALGLGALAFTRRRAREALAAATEPSPDQE